MESIFEPYQPIGKIRELESTTPFDDPSSSILDIEGTIRSPVYFIILVVLCSSILLTRLFNLQIVKGARNFFLAEGNRIRRVIMPAPRGIMYDRTGEPLVKNIAEYSLVVIPSDLPRQKSDRDQVFDLLMRRLNSDKKKTIEELFLEKIASIEPVELITKMPQEEAIKWEIELIDMPGVSILKKPERQYVTFPSVGHILGYIGKVDEETLQKKPAYVSSDTIGKSGLELSYESILRGIPGAQQFEVNAKGALQRSLANIDAKQGNDLQLTIDLGLQQISAAALAEQNNDQNKKAVTIVVNPKDGNILSMVSLPDFDPNIFVTQNNEAIASLLKAHSQPLVNRSIVGQYPPGSTIKPIWAAAALQEKIISPQFSIDTPGEITIGQFTFPDWKDHGLTDIRRAIAESNNIFFYALAGGWDRIKGLGIERLEKYMKLFRFGEKTGIDLPAESAGFVPTPAWKLKKKKERWYIGDTYHLGIGQGDILVTPLQLLTAEASLFNDGKMMKPHLVNSIVDNNGQVVRQIKPEVINELPIDRQALDVVKEGMRLTITQGSGRSLNDVKDKNGQPVEIAGKTGTAQFGNEDKTHAWFIGFAPWNNPEIGVLVLVEGGGEGHAVAAPVAKKIFEHWFNK